MFLKNKYLKNILIFSKKNQKEIPEGNLCLFAFVKFNMTKIE